MRLSVYQYPVPLEDEFTIELPPSAQVLSFQAQHGEPFLWALLDPEARHVQRRFRVAGTGHLIDHDANALRFVGTIQLRNGALVFHLFEVLT